MPIEVSSVLTGALPSELRLWTDVAWRRPQRDFGKNQVNWMKPVHALDNTKAGTMMIEEGSPRFQVETDAYPRHRRTVTTLDSFALSHVLDALGWHLFFVAGQVKTAAFGRAGEKSLHKAVQRIAAKVRALNLNCLELTEIASSQEDRLRLQHNDELSSGCKTR